MWTLIIQLDWKFGGTVHVSGARYMPSIGWNLLPSPRSAMRGLFDATLAWSFTGGPILRTAGCRMKLMLGSQTIGAPERNLCTHFPRWLAMYRDATKECLVRTASKLGSVLCCGMSASLIRIVTAQSQEFAVFGALVSESLEYSTNISVYSKNA